MSSPTDSNSAPDAGSQEPTPGSHLLKTRELDEQVNVKCKQDDAVTAHFGIDLFAINTEDMLPSSQKRMLMCTQCGLIRSS